MLSLGSAARGHCQAANIIKLVAIRISTARQDIHGAAHFGLVRSIYGSKLQHHILFGYARTSALSSLHWDKVTREMRGTHLNFRT